MNLIVLHIPREEGEAPERNALKAAIAAAKERQAQGATKQSADGNNVRPPLDPRAVRPSQVKKTPATHGAGGGQERTESGDDVDPDALKRILYGDERR